MYIYSTAGLKRRFSTFLAMKNPKMNPQVKKSTSIFVKFIPSKKIYFRENWAIRSKAGVVQIYSHLIFVPSKKLPSKTGLKRYVRLKPL